MAGQVMEAPMHQQQAPTMLLGQLQAHCKTADHHLATTTTTMLTSSGAAATTPTAAEMASYLQQLQTAAAAAEANGSNNGGARGEQCPRCASHDTKFCYYNNYNTSQPRHFCRACRRYWTLGGSLRNVPIGGSTRKRPRLAPPPSRRHPLHVFAGAGAHAAAASNNPMPPPQGLLGSLFALGAGAPLLEGRAGPGFDLGLGLPLPVPAAGGAGELGAQMQQLGLGLRGGAPLNGSASALLWPAGLLDNDGAVDAWKLPGIGGAAIWPDFSAAAGGLLHGGAQLM